MYITSYVYFNCIDLNLNTKFFTELFVKLKYVGTIIKYDKIIQA